MQNHVLLYLRLVILANPSEAKFNEGTGERNVFDFMRPWSSVL
jgi:hypothetical protein